MAYRLRYIFKTRNASAFDHAVQLLERLNAISREQGITERRLMTQTFGPFNQLAVDVDYPDLATYERETESFFALPEVNEVIRQLPAVLRESDRGKPSCGRTLPATRRLRGPHGSLTNLTGVP